MSMYAWLALIISVCGWAIEFRISWGTKKVAEQLFGAIMQARLQMEWRAQALTREINEKGGTTPDEWDQP